MNKAMINEVNELWNNGHAEALAAYGRECANAGVTGYQDGYNVAKALTLMTIGLGVITGIAAHEIHKKLVQKRRAKENKKYAEVIDV